MLSVSQSLGVGWETHGLQLVLSLEVIIDC